MSNSWRRLSAFSCIHFNIFKCIRVLVKWWVLPETHEFYLFATGFFCGISHLSLIIMPSLVFRKYTDELQKYRKKNKKKNVVFVRLSLHTIFSTYLTLGWFVYIETELECAIIWVCNVFCCFVFFFFSWTIWDSMLHMMSTRSTPLKSSTWLQQT